MTVLEFLRQPQMVSVQIEHCLTEMQRWDDLAYRIAENAGTQSQEAKRKLADAVDFCMGMEADISEQVKQLAEVKKQTEEKILLLDNPMEQKVLLKRYIQGITLQEIADDLNTTYGNVTTIQGRAIKHLQEVLCRQ